MRDPSGIANQPTSVNDGPTSNATRDKLARALTSAFNVAMMGLLALMQYMLARS